MFIEPVFGKKFFGREEVLGTLQKRVTALKGGYRQNMALTGPMLAGKTSILKHFLNNVADPGIIPLYIEMDGMDFPLFCMQFMAALLFRYLKSNGRTAGELLAELQKETASPAEYDREMEFAALKKMCCNLIPETVRCMDEVYYLLKKRKNNTSYEKILELTSIFKNETGKNCIVILDEFHNLSNFKLKKPFQTFGKFIMVQKNTMYVVSSSQKTLLKEILSKKLSLLFGNFEVIEINGFDSRTARSFISDKIERSDALDDIKNYFIQISQGNPFYLEVFIKEFSDLSSTAPEEENARECLLEVFSRVLYDSNGVLNRYFMNSLNFFLEKKTRKNFIPVLMSLAKGNSTIKSIQKDLKKKDPELGMKLQKLREMDLLETSGGFYLISDKLFEYWIKYVYCLKEQSVIDDMDIKYLEFKKNIGCDYERYHRSSARDVKETICDLFRSFDNNKVKVNMNLRKIPRFDTVESRFLSENIIEIEGKVSKKEWLCHVKRNDIADENDVGRLWNSEANDPERKIIRKILIPLEGIEQNAFLLAKEQNIWVWDIEFINRKLRFFGKFEIVL
ncbi:MAG: ATP-binding protein [Candidatus Omnitrophica bacterium]|nr:ATP-binding protein [Candidatus Omnitrophota bacterium]